MLTSKNRQAIDLYLSADPECSGNGGKSWKRVYGIKRIETARASWSRMLTNANAKAYLATCRQELEDKRIELIAYEQAEAVRDYLRIQRAAMQMVNRGRVARKVKRKDPGTGEETGEVEYADVHGMLNPGEAIRATEQAIRVQGKHPDQRAEGAGVMVNIQIATEWRGIPGTEPIDVTEAPDEPPESEEESPRVVVIGRK